MGDRDIETDISERNRREKDRDPKERDDNRTRRERGDGRCRFVVRMSEVIR